MKGIVKYFSKSSFGTANLANENWRNSPDEKIQKLQKVGRTRFGTHWTSATTLQPCLPNIRALAEHQTITFKVVLSTHVNIIANLCYIEQKYSTLVHQPADREIQRI